MTARHGPATNQRSPPPRPRSESAEDRTWFRYRLILAGIQVWMALFGSISFILFGQLHNVVTDVETMFDAIAQMLGQQVFSIEQPTSRV